MTLFGIVSILLGALTFRFAIIEPTRLRISMFAILFVIHLVATFVFYAYVQVQGGDTELYYYDELDFYSRGFALSTGAVIFFVQILKGSIGGSYLDYFMLFQSIGFCGIALLMRTFEEIHLGLESGLFEMLRGQLGRLHTSAGLDRRFLLLAACLGRGLLAVLLALQFALLVGGGFSSGVAGLAPRGRFLAHAIGLHASCHGGPHAARQM